jgi:ABC-type Zn2+ transport system substrate-binding protein/surface adhesin
VFVSTPATRVGFSGPHSFFVQRFAASLKPVHVVDDAIVDGVGERAIAVQIVVRRNAS